MKVLIIYSPKYGHFHRMTEAVAEGAEEVKGTEVEMRRVPEKLPPEVLAKMGAVEAQKAFSQIPICKVDELPLADAVIFGTPTRFGNMCGQMRIDEMTGGSPYGASTIAGGQGERMLSDNELDAARFQGKHVATIATKLSK
jgi:NAD(P)H dehydrogenase (quinone)